MPAGVRVTRNRHKPTQADKPWLVHCAICTGDDSILSAFMPTLLGWGSDWTTVYIFALTHALAHEARRCTTCLHLPAGPLTTANRP